jgi:hypothetical protein
VVELGRNRSKLDFNVSGMTCQGGGWGLSLPPY